MTVRVKSDRNMNTQFRYRENIHKCSTTDDCNILIKYRSNDKIILLIKHQKDIWKILNKTNTYICQCNTSFILKNKPVFDKQKLILIKLDLLTNNIISIGLTKCLVDRKIKYDDGYLLDITTFNIEWNEKASIINNYIKNIIIENNKEYVTIDILNTINNNNNIQYDNGYTIINKFVILFILIISTIIYFKFIYPLVYQKYQNI
jgi:hypothetical protein